MNNYKIEPKQAFRLISFKTTLNEGTTIHAPEYTSDKTTFFKSMLENGQMASLRPYSESPYGYAAVAIVNDKVNYYAGVQSSKPLPEHADELLFPAGDYLILSGSGGLSRLAFDKLENQAFGSLLTDEYKFEYKYSGGPIAEVLLNGKPMDAEVEVWVPVQKRKAT
ncbi:effector binding domain-containing protein [Paenibacillus sp. F6_3S_P_1C]|uniref:Effector binding domain-containing protein n=1 Tax=Paenibacillus vandeheii TaxID=3035917 RepID=A0ABT8JJ99_9BACL|nr:effector binding domain-containing protein [Paenibacillus vandeheii]MDN4605130.1 effector binding domain-containing protein [Paenibacillus vandeheii]